MAFIFHNPYSVSARKRAQSFFLSLSEKDRRHFAAIEALRLGHGSIGYLANIFHCSRRTIERGISEIDSKPSPPTHRIRRPGAGRKKKSFRIR